MTELQLTAQNILMEGDIPSLTKTKVLTEAETIALMENEISAIDPKVKANIMKYAKEEAEKQSDNIFKIVLQNFKDPKKSVNPLAIIREQFLTRTIKLFNKEFDPVNSKLSNRYKILCAIALVEFDGVINALLIPRVINILNTKLSKISQIVGKINMILIIKVLNVIHKTDIKLPIGSSDEVFQMAYDTFVKQPGMDELKDFGAYLATTGIVAALNEEASKHVANKFGVEKQYFIVFNAMEFTKYVGILGEAGVPIKDASLLRIMPAIMHLLATLLHKFKLPWLAYMLHLLWNTFSGLFSYIVLGRKSEFKQAMLAFKEYMNEHV